MLKPDCRQPHRLHLNSTAGVLKVGHRGSVNDTQPTFVGVTLSPDHRLCGWSEEVVIWEPPFTGRFTP
eukprot:3941800-Rhodomonas_salina.5